MLRFEKVQCQKCKKIFTRTSGGFVNNKPYEFINLCPECKSSKRKEAFHKLKSLFDK